MINRAEACELIGIYIYIYIPISIYVYIYIYIYIYIYLNLRYIYILCLISSKYNPNSIRISRDDGLVVLRNTSGPQSEEMQKMFKTKILDIIIECSLKIGNYLDVTLNLDDESYLFTKNLMKKQIINM